MLPVRVPCISGLFAAPLAWISAFTLPDAFVPCDNAIPEAAAIFAASAIETLFALTCKSRIAGVALLFTVPLTCTGVDPSFTTRLRMASRSVARSSVMSYCATTGKPSSMPCTLAFWTRVSPCAVNLPDWLSIFVSPVTIPSVPFNALELRNFDRSAIPTCFRLSVPRKGVAMG